MYNVRVYMQLYIFENTQLLNKMFKFQALKTKKINWKLHASLEMIS